MNLRQLLQSNNYRDNHYKQTQHGTTVKTSDTVRRVRTQSRGHPMREHADTLPPFVTLRACGLALMHNGGANPDTDHHRKGKRPLTAR